MGENSFITSDRGIQKTLSAKGLEILYVSPEGILLPGFRNGFFGGSCGLHEGSLFISGSLTHFGEGQNVRRFADNHSVEIIELYDGPLVDGGGIFFLDNSDIH
jgi:hypothetical protein